MVRAPALFTARIACALATVTAAACGTSAPRAHRHGSLSARERPASASGCELGEAEGPRVCAIARVDAETGIVDVALSLDPAALPSERRDVRLAFRAGALGERYVEERVDLIEGRWALGALTRPARVRYRVTLDPAGDAPRRSFRRARGWHVTGLSFLPDIIVDGTRAEVPATLRIDAGPAPVWTAAGSDRRLYDAPSLLRLADEAYEVGPLVTTRRDAGGAILWIGASAPEDARAIEALADVLARAMDALARRLGPPPADAILVAVHAADAPAHAERLGTSLTYRGRDGARADPLHGALALALEELVRFWAPGTHASVEEWLAEGVGDYLALVTAAELAGAPPESVARDVLAQRRGAGDPRSLGITAAFCLDAYLESEGSSLGAVLRTTLARDDDEPIGAEALLEDLAAISPASAGQLAALLEGVPDALDECLERYGFDAREVAYEGWTDLSLARDVLGARELRALGAARGLVIEAVDPEASPFEAGDVVLEVEGVRVGSLDDLAWALRNRSAGARATASIRRRGEPRSVALELPRTGDDRREPRAYLELVPVGEREAP
ncbi:MAG TPA: PDZ domain-containing protein [Sandaracinaceae bacterium]